MVIEVDPVTDNSHRVLPGFGAVAMNALLLQGPDQSFDHAVLLRAMRRDELLTQAVAPHESTFTSWQNQRALNAHRFLSLADTGSKIEAWRYNEAGPLGIPAGDTE